MVISGSPASSTWAIDLGLRYDAKGAPVVYRLIGSSPRPEVRMTKAEKQSDMSLGRRWLVREYEASEPTPRNKTRREPTPVLARWTTRVLVQVFTLDVEDRPVVLENVSALDRSRVKLQQVTTTKTASERRENA